MYLEMIHETEKAIQIPVNVQRQCEDIYINSPGLEAEPPQQNNTDNAYPSHPVNKAKKESWKRCCEKSVDKSLFSQHLFYTQKSLDFYNIKMIQ